MLEQPPSPPLFLLHCPNITNMLLLNLSHLSLDPCAALTSPCYLTELATLHCNLYFFCKIIWFIDGFTLMGSQNPENQLHPNDAANSKMGNVLGLKHNMYFLWKRANSVIPLYHSGNPPALYTHTLIHKHRPIFPPITAAVTHTHIVTRNLWHTHMLM